MIASRQPRQGGEARTLDDEGHTVVIGVGGRALHPSSWMSLRPSSSTPAIVAAIAAVNICHRHGHCHRRRQCGRAQLQVHRGRRGGGARGRETTLVDEGRAVVDGNVGVEYVIFLNGYASDIYIICFHHPYLSSSPSTPPSTPSQHAKVDLKSLIVSVIPIYSLSDIINLFCLLCFS